MTIQLNRSLTRLILTTLAAVPMFAQAPTVYVDSLASGATVYGTVVVSGWAVDSFQGGSAISSVLIQVDGLNFGNANMGISRPDVCAAMPLSAGCPNVGWAYSFNSSVLSPGSHTITVLAFDLNRSVGTMTLPIVVGPNTLVVIDSPTSGAAVTGAVNVTGWALPMNSGQPISSVQVIVDGAVAGNATYGVSRSDVCAVHPGVATCPNVGYTFSLDTTKYYPGTHTITVVASDSISTASATSNFNAILAPSVFIDGPAQGAVVGGMVNVSGWAIDSAEGVGSGISSVQMMVDGVPAGAANYGVSRTDVCNSYPGRPNCPNVGFTYQLNTAALAPGTHTLTAAAAATDMLPGAATWTTNLTVTNSTLVTIENPTQGSYITGNYVTLSGWALDASSNGTPISSVAVAVDGVPVGSAYYGIIARPDICGSFQGAAGCPNIGFFYYLNANALPMGPHTVTVTATDSSNPPNTGSASVAVNSQP